MEQQFDNLFESIYSQQIPGAKYRQPAAPEDRDPNAADDHKAFDRNTFTDWEQDKEPTALVNPQEEQEIVDFLHAMREALTAQQAGDNRMMNRLVHAPTKKYEEQDVSLLQYMQKKYGHVDVSRRSVVDPRLNQ